MLVVNVIPFLSVLFMVIILTVLDSFHPMDALGACLRLACTYWYLLRVADVALWHPFTAVSVEDILDAENEAVEKYCQDLLTVSSSSHEEPSSSRSIWAIARRFETWLSERSGSAAFVFGPDTLQTYLEAENEAVEKYCQDLLNASSSSHEEPSFSRSIWAIARRLENLHSERSGSAASNVSAGPAGERKLLNCSSISFSLLTLKL